MFLIVFNGGAEISLADFRKMRNDQCGKKPSHKHNFGASLLNSSAISKVSSSLENREKPGPKLTAVHFVPGVLLRAIKGLSNDVYEKL
uniref:Uncharacterized protein n=1 Tax=Romanomermis culicivorax TaxID=13658 RepID=A0A915IU52_ROMCU